MLYALTGRTANSLSQILADGGSRVGRGRTATPARGVTWVKVTGAISSGWYPGVVSLDAAGTFEDLDQAVKVKSADGSALASGSRYLCTRTGDDSGDGKACFRTWSAGGSGASGAFDVSELATSHFNITSDTTWVNSGVSVTVPEAGTYLLTYAASAALWLSAGGPEFIATRLYDATAGAAIAGTTLVVCGAQGTAQQAQGGNGIAIPVTFEEESTVRIEAFRTNLNTSTYWAHPSLRSNDVSASVPGGTTLSYLRIA